MKAKILTWFADRYVERSSRAGMAVMIAAAFTYLAATDPTTKAQAVTAGRL